MSKSFNCICSAYFHIYAITRIVLFLIGNLLYYGVEIALAYIFKDYRAFCKYVCPITVFLKPMSYYSLLRVHCDEKNVFIVESDHVVTNPVYCFLARLTILFMVLGWVDVFTGWTGIFERFPLLHDKNIIKRILGYFLACCCVLLVAAMMQGVFQSILSVS